MCCARPPPRPERAPLQWRAAARVSTVVVAETDAQRNNPRETDVGPCMDPVGLGMLLAMANLVVIAAGMSVMEHAPAMAVAVNVFALGFVPATFTGALLGKLAHKARIWPVGARWILLAGPALLLVVGLGRFFQFPEYIVPAFAPTLAAACLLEQRTRDRMPPVARAVARERRV